MAKKTDNAMPKTETKTKLGQVLRIAGGEGGIGRKELKSILETGGKNVSAGQVVKRLDKINAKLAENDLTGINIKSGAVNYLTKQPGSMLGSGSMLGFGSQFGTGKIGQSLQSLMGTPGYTAPRNPQSGAPMGGSFEGTPRTILPRGIDLMPSGRQTVRDIGKQYEVPSRLMQPTSTDTTTTGGGATATGGGGIAGEGGTGTGTVPTDGITAPTVDTTVDTTADSKVALPNFSTALANWAQGFRRKKSSRQGAGRSAQGLGSQRVTPTGSFRGGV